MKKIKGIAAASGIHIGKAFLLGKEELLLPQDKIRKQDIPSQIQLFEEALIKTRQEIIDLQNKIAKDMGTDSARIFDAHLLVLEDRTLIEEVITRLKKEQRHIAYIFSLVLQKYVQVFSKIEDEYLKERVSDIKDIGKRVLRNLLGEKKLNLDEIKEEVILVAHDLSPSDTAAMHKRNVSAFVTDIGTKTSHTAIMAKSLEIPAVVGLEKATSEIKNGDILIVDGVTGVVVINPDEKTISSYKKEEKKLDFLSKKYLSLRKLPAVTKDSKKVNIVANIELPDEIPTIRDHGAEGIGLYRTEFFYMNRDGLPTEEEHFEAYKYVAQSMRPYPVIIRTLDLGGDKFISQLKVPVDMSPFLGWRAIRFCLARPDIFKTQLRAILRASSFGNLKLMYPMISGIEELRQANILLDEVKKELKSKNISFNKDIEVGVMIEVPSAALTADILAKEADFFSIGTNDLIQYSLAVDRTNEKVAYLYEPAHPAMLRMIKNIIQAGHTANIKVGMCGEMAAEPAYSFLLLGLGLDEFSIPSALIPEIKEIIRSITIDEAKSIVEQAMEFSSGKEVEEFCRRKLNELLKND
ncbi:MAG: phosphoenolpyruvate--protein phosphotransferase [Candidatus Omnitrophota bacterium]